MHEYRRRLNAGEAWRLYEVFSGTHSLVGCKLLGEGLMRLLMGFLWNVDLVVMMEKAASVYFCSSFNKFGSFPQRELRI